MTTSNELIAAARSREAAAEALESLANDIEETGFGRVTPAGLREVAAEYRTNPIEGETK